MTRAARTPSGRVVITGIGVVSGWGWGADVLWEGLRSGRRAISPPERFDTTGQRTHLASEVPVPSDEVVGKISHWHRLSWADRFAMAAALEACGQADLFPSGPQAGVFFGSSTAAMSEGEEFFHSLVGESKRRALVRSLVSHQMNGPGDEVARQFGISGPVFTVSSACAAGGLALGAALESLRRGEVQVALAGGADSLCHLTYSGFNSLRAVDEELCRPFRADRAGLNIGEGAGVLVLETLEAARERGAEPLAELLGAGASCDAYHMTAPHPCGAGAALAINAALEDSGLEPDQIDFVNTHGTGTPHNDISEARALHEVFGPRAAKLPITSTKGSVGHLLGSSGALEAAATVQCLLEKELHPTPGEDPADEDLKVDLVLGTPRPLAAESRGLSTSFAFGGSNAAVVLGSVSQGAQL
ncbi:MAG: beta-ketoacyl-[acyl-carrier-protein] synthase family protein [Deltaproteobacteria bacterium]|nr:beta-ketoacyl-[acyl-carrier-protein] synthase family protein [Deltaproteobacteria bacterium]